MLLPWLCTLLHAAYGPPLQLRAGIHASAHDVSGLLGLEARMDGYGIVLDGWARPFYWKTLEQTSPTRWAQYRILRFGFDPSVYVLFGSRGLGLLPMAGVELVTGDIAGSSKLPEGEVAPWVGLAVAFAEHQQVGLRVAAREGVLGWVRGEWVASW